MALYISLFDCRDEGLPHGTVHIKVDSGMSRNGCQPHQLPILVQVSKTHTYMCIYICIHEWIHRWSVI